MQGPTTGPADDELLEAKELKDLGDLRCLEERASLPALRVIDGTTQLGRIKLNVLAAGPELVIPELTTRGRQLRDWWIRSWDPSYREVRLEDIRSVKDLAAIAYDAGIQLGAGGLLDSQDRQAEARTREVTSLARLEARIRQETSASSSNCCSDGKSCDAANDAPGKPAFCSMRSHVRSLHAARAHPRRRLRRAGRGVSIRSRINGEPHRPVSD